MRRPTTHGHRESGVVLMVVLFFALLLAATVASFQRRSLVDAMIARNRESAAQAEALARGGVRLAQAMLAQDRVAEQSGAPATDHGADLWGWLASQTLEVAGGSLRVSVQDTGGRLNLNALFRLDDQSQRVARSETEEFLVAVLGKIVEEMPLPPGEKVLYEPRELARNLIDWVDEDTTRVQGGPEDAYYQDQDPRYRAANHPLLSVDDLRLVEGFDAPLFEALEPYVSVYPYAPGGCGALSVGCGINLNTAPPHVLTLLYYNDGVEARLASEDVVRKILKARSDSKTICGGSSGEETCTPLAEIVVNPIFPPPTFASQVFFVVAQASVGEVRRRVEAVVDRSDTSQPRLLSWHVR